MEIWMLPFELQLEILQYVDGVTLVQTQRVCQLWNKLVKVLGKNRDIWKKKCSEEICKEVIVELTGRESFMQLSNSIKNEGGVIVKEDYWKCIYSEWYRGRFIGKWNYWKQQTGKYRANITCAKVSGTLLFTGLTNGEVVQWDSMTGEFIKSVCMHLSPVTDIILRKSDVYYKRHDSDYQHDIMVSIAKSGLHINHLSSLNGQNSRHVFVNVCAISMWKDMLVIGTMQRNVQLWRFSNMSKMSLIAKLIGHEANIKSVSIYKNTIISGSDDCTVKVWCVSSTQCLYTFQHNHWLNHLVLRDNIALGISGDSVIHLYEINQEKQIYNKIEMLHEVSLSTYNTFALRGNLLALGNSAGQVIIYYLDLDEKLRRYKQFESHKENILDEETHSTSCNCLTDYNCRQVAMPTVSFSSKPDEQPCKLHGRHGNNIGVKTRSDAAGDGSSDILPFTNTISLGRPIYTINTGKDFVTSIDIDDDGNGPVIVVSTKSPYTQIYRWNSLPFKIDICSDQINKFAFS